MPNVKKSSSSSFWLSSSVTFDYEDEDEVETDRNFNQINRNALAKSSGFLAIQCVTASGANHSPHSISSGCN